MVLFEDTHHTWLMHFILLTYQYRPPIIQNNTTIRTCVYIDVKYISSPCEPEGSCELKRGGGERDAEISHLQIGVPKYSKDKAGIVQLKKQRTNGPVNAHLISGPGISINHTTPDSKSD